ncbi:serine hydrolase domain-containing protein [Pseudalkalibacillus caeni]|nr:serine hydrolase domain-containing protein [Pseudalkalibacillus caeni]
MIQQWVDEKKIPGAVINISVGKKIVLQKAFGGYTDNEGSYRSIETSTIFDVASLTKVVSTLPSVLLLVAGKQINLTDPIAAYLPAFHHRNITIKNLLLHNSGLAAKLPYKKRNETRDVLQEIYQQPLTDQTGKVTVYSDLGMILLGKLIEVVYGESLSSFASQNIFKPLKMEDTMFNPSEKLKARITPTEKVDGKFVHGSVHDEKTYHLGGAAGSAGLFSTADDLTKYANWWLYPEKQSILPKDLMVESRTHHQDNRGYGFEVWSGNGEPPSCGEKWSSGSFGHTGFTGTSMWIDPEKDLSVIFLTNAVHYGRNTPIKDLRRQLHTGIYSSLFGE